jgi:putative transposase
LFYDAFDSDLQLVSGHAFRRAAQPPQITNGGFSRPGFGRTTIGPVHPSHPSVGAFRENAAMAIPLRHSDPAAIAAGLRTFFVTSSIAEKRNLLQSHRSAKLFIAVLYHYRDQQKYLLHDFVVMPDHFHILITVEGEMTIERAVQFIKGGFAFRAGKELGFSAPVWQRGFSEVRIYDSQAIERVKEYIALNPVKRGMAANPAEYLYSSAHGGSELDEVPQGLKPKISLRLVGTPEGVP